MSDLISKFTFFSVHRSLRDAETKSIGYFSTQDKAEKAKGTGFQNYPDTIKRVEGYKIGDRFFIGHLEEIKPDLGPVEARAFEKAKAVLSTQEMKALGLL
ncbi:hypothetical protein GF420_15750 [candidate division GN15 bacterium]|nr:hypothetical protein [candidate division GN15 bacterium]